MRSEIPAGGVSVTAYEAPTLALLGHVTDPPVRVVDVVADASGWRLIVDERPMRLYDGEIVDAWGNTRYRCVLWPSAAAAVESATDYLRISVGDRVAASALRASALAELRS